MTLMVEDVQTQDARMPFEQGDSRENWKYGYRLRTESCDRQYLVHLHK
jgi:hypothetical protein